jgi:hypothetical protein
VAQLAKEKVSGDIENQALYYTTHNTSALKYRLHRDNKVQMHKQSAAFAETGLAFGQETT